MTARRGRGSPLKVFHENTPPKTKGPGGGGAKTKIGLNSSVTLFKLNR